eukprot:scaffold80197_cov53-Phaeocystis_antarctica.AAC.3
MPGRTAYGKPAGWFRCCSPLAFLCARATLALFWLAIFVWSLVESALVRESTWPNHGPSFDSNLGPEPEQVWNASGTATSAPEKDCANYAGTTSSFRTQLSAVPSCQVCHALDARPGAPLLLYLWQCESCEQSFKIRDN